MAAVRRADEQEFKELETAATEDEITSEQAITPHP
jgi:hypothetical protein